MALTDRDSTLCATFVDVGQGDCTFIQTPSGRTILIDGGGKPDGRSSDSIGRKIVEPFLRRKGVNRLDLIVLTHPHDDHVQGLIPVLRDFSVGLVLDPALPHGSQSYRRFLSTVQSRHIPYKVANRGQHIRFADGTDIEILNPPSVRFQGTDDDLNNNSIVSRVVYAGRAIVLAGDAGMTAEADILASGKCVRGDLLKVGHHGSRSATGDAWLGAIRPERAVISAGRHNSFGHPSEEVLARLLTHGVKTSRTDINGTITLRLGAKN